MNGRLAWVWQEHILRIAVVWQIRQPMWQQPETLLLCHENWSRNIHKYIIILQSGWKISPMWQNREQKNLDYPTPISFWKWQRIFRWRDWRRGLLHWQNIVCQLRQRKMVYGWLLRSWRHRTIRLVLLMRRRCSIMGMPTVSCMRIMRCRFFPSCQYKMGWQRVFP